RAAGCRSTGSCSVPRSMARAWQKPRRRARRPARWRRSSLDPSARLEMTPAARPREARAPAPAWVAGSRDDAAAVPRRQRTRNPPADESRFARAAWSDAKGRVRALFDVARSADRFLLVAERDGLESVLAKLRLFVLRSRVELAIDERLAVG